MNRCPIFGNSYVWLTAVLAHQSAGPESVRVHPCVYVCLCALPICEQPRMKALFISNMCITRLFELAACAVIFERAFFLSSILQDFLTVCLKKIVRCYEILSLFYFTMNSPFFRSKLLLLKEYVFYNVSIQIWIKLCSRCHWKSLDPFHHVEFQHNLINNKLKAN